MARPGASKRLEGELAGRALQLSGVFPQVLDDDFLRASCVLARRYTIERTLAASRTQKMSIHESLYIRLAAHMREG
jgi:hypothetical protein